MNLLQVFPGCRFSQVPAYPFAALQAMKAQAVADGQTVIDASFGSPRHPILDGTLAALVQAFHSTGRGYTTRNMSDDIRLAFAKRQHRWYDLELDPAFVAVTVGLKLGLKQLFLGLGGGSPRPRMLGSAKSYPSHLWGPTFAGIDVLPFQSGPDMARNIAIAYEQAVAEQPLNPPRIVLICNPHNPTAYVAGERELLEAGEYCIGKGMVIVYDGAYMDIVENGVHAPSMLKLLGHVPGAMIVEGVSMTKSYGLADFRLGFLYGTHEIMRHQVGFQDFFEYGQAKFTLGAAKYVLDNGDNFVLDVSEDYRRRRHIVYHGLTEAGYEMERPMGSIFAWGKVPEQYRYDGGSAHFVNDLFQEECVLITPGTGFGPDGEGYFRYAYVMDDMECADAVYKMAQFQQKLVAQAA